MKLKIIIKDKSEYAGLWRLLRKLEGIEITTGGHALGNYISLNNIDMTEAHTIYNLIIMPNGYGSEFAVSKGVKPGE